MEVVVAQIRISAGPDEGKTFDLTAEMIHVGRGEDNEIILTDPAIAEHQASLVSRNGRYALYAHLDESVTVDGNPVPAEKWVWLPAHAVIRLSEQTVLEFHHPEPSTSESVAEKEPAATEKGNAHGEGKARSSAGVRKSRPAGNSRKRRSKRKANVARFITDREGDPLVKLGEDGQLPELSLREAAQHQKQDQAPKEKNPLLLYGVLVCSFVTSLGMLLLEPAGSTVSSETRDKARQQLTEYFGAEGEKFEPYQIVLRRALVEHSQGDFAEERRAYRKVLQMLNAADIRDPANLNGLTGEQTGRGRASDEDLRKLLETLLSR